MLVPELTGPHIALLVLLTFALSLFSYHLIENPIRRNGWLIAGTARSLGFAALITTTGAAIAYASATLAARNLNADPQQRMIAESAKRPSFVRQTDPNCVADFETVEPKPCVFGATSSRRDRRAVRRFARRPLVDAACSDRQQGQFPAGDLHEIVVPGDTDHHACLELEKNLYGMRRLAGARAQADHRDEAEHGHHLPVRDIQHVSRSHRPVRICRAPQGMGRRREIDGRGARQCRHPGRLHARRPVQQALCRQMRGARAVAGQGLVGLRCIRGRLR